MRMVALDTETTGLKKGKFNISHGHRIIEIAAVEIVDNKITKNKFHSYINPGMKISEKAQQVHGIRDEFLIGKPKFEDISSKLLEFIGDSDIIIHNAPFDISFLDQEFRLLKTPPHGRIFKVIDTLRMTRNRYPGQDNSLLGLCKRFGIPCENSHSALSDATMLANLFVLLFPR